MKNQGITLIALVLTIIVLIILTGVTVATLTGENGILQKANDAREAMKLAEAEEAIKLQLLACQTEYAVNKNMNVPEYIAKQNKDIEVEQDDGTTTGNIGTGEPLSYWLMTYKGYIFEINNLQIEGSRKDEPSPIAVVNVEEDYKFASKVGSNSVTVEMDITLPPELAGATISVAQSTEATSQGTGTVTGNYDATTGKYTGTIEADETISSNGKYVYEIKATKNGKDYSINKVVNIKNFLGNPQIEVPEEDIKWNELKIKVMNNYPEDAHIQYKYYISETTDYPIEHNFTDKTEVTKIDAYSPSLNSNTELKEATTYHIKVEAYLENKTTMVETITQATTEDKYIEIRTIEDLENMNNDLSNKYKLMNDLDFKQRRPSYSTDEKFNYYNQDDNGDGKPDNSWIDLRGTDGKGFKGKFNGGYHTIKNLYVSQDSQEGYGLFHDLSGATIINLYLEGVNVSGNDYAGAVASSVENNPSTIKRVSVEGTVSSNNSATGGIVGHLNGGTIEECYSNCEIPNISRGPVGGIAGYGSGSIKNSYSVGTVQGNDAGGIAGWWGTGINCYSLANIAGYRPGPLTGNTYGSYYTQFTNSYWCEDTSGTTTGLSGAGDGVQYNDGLFKRETYQNWDFDKVWEIKEGQTTPYLKWMKNPPEKVKKENLDQRLNN